MFYGLPCSLGWTGGPHLTSGEEERDDDRSQRYFIPSRLTGPQSSRAAGSTELRGTLQHCGAKPSSSIQSRRTRLWGNLLGFGCAGSSSADPGHNCPSLGTSKINITFQAGSTFSSSASPHLASPDLPGVEKGPGQAAPRCHTEPNTNK